MSNETENIKIPDTTNIENETSLIVKEGQGLTVVTHADYLVAGTYLKNNKEKQKFVIDLFKETKEAAHAAHAKVCALEKKLLEPLKIAEKIAGDRVKTFLLEEDKRKRAEAEKLQREFEEQQRLARIEAERVRREAEEKAAIERQALIKQKEDEKAKLAAQLQENGFQEEAKEFLEQAIDLPPPTPVFVKPVEKMEKVPGIHTRDSYKAEIVDLMALVVEIAARRQPLSFVVGNYEALDLQAKSLKNEMRIPGVKVRIETSLVTKRSA